MDVDLLQEEYKCCQVVSKKSVDNLTRQLEEYLSSIKLQASDVLKFLEYTSKLVHENHYLRLIAKRYLSQLLPCDDVRKVQFCYELLEIFDKLDPGYSHSRGMTLCELFKVTQKREIVPEIISCLEMEPLETLAGKACEKILLLSRQNNGNGGHHN